MPSTFTWVDYSERERRRALDVISLFKQRETRDELGIGSVRDAFAELFSPGTSTIQTRARYFLLIPWMYLDFERRRTPGDRIERRARSFEIRLIDALAASEDSAGTIGIEARRALQRLPSSVYWAGLKRWGILLFAGSRHQYHRYLDAFYERARHVSSLPRDAESPSGEPVNWHPHIPPPPDAFPHEASLALTVDEAVYLRDRIRSMGQGSLLAHIVDLDEPWREVALAWLHPAKAEFPPRLIEQLDHARKFSEVMHGVTLLYNLMLAEAIGREEWISGYEDRLEAWARQMGEQARDLAAWDRGRFWQIAHANNRRIPLNTRAFVDTWISLVAAPKDPGALRQNDEAQRLVTRREAQLKGSRARLQSRRHLELWRGDSASSQIDFRWPITQTIALDILRALT